MTKRRKHPKKGRPMQGKSLRVAQSISIDTETQSQIEKWTQDLQAIQSSAKPGQIVDMMCEHCKATKFNPVSL